MSELIQENNNRVTIRWKLLTGTSAMVLTAYLSSVAIAEAADPDSPTVWIELGGQLDRVAGTPETFSPPFLAIIPAVNLAPMVDAQKPSPYAFGLDGKISFEPAGTDWVFSAAVRYGRSGNSRHLHHQTVAPGYTEFLFGARQYKAAYLDRFGDGQTASHETHAVIDFQVGRDIGVGLFDADSHSVVSAGVRFAQFTSSSHVTLHARPMASYAGPFTYPGLITNVYLPAIHATYTAVVGSRRSTRAVGPSISWDASVPIAGHNSDTTLNVDWGVNAAILFGRQRAQVHHQTTGHSYERTGAVFAYATHSNHYTHTPPDQNRSRAVTIPNLGGFAGLSIRLPNAAIKFGYRADFFFGAVDTGIDSRHEANQGFHGPYATISIGLGG